MTNFGYTLMTEQSGPRELVNYAVAGEQAGFDFEVMSDHYSPWLTEQGHSPYAWSVLGAVAHATERVGLMTYITCPSMRYHPAVVAQKAATVALLSDGRFSLGLGSGENLNEHTIGRGWPAIETRHEMLAEAIEIIRALWNVDGGPVEHRGTHYRIAGAQPGPAPAHDIGIWLGAYKPRMLRLTGAKADGWVPSMGYVEL
ncbi:MAG TPA: TIGR03557 family F420-dependent LLM class oxidoreductase, partial [Nocardioides sp.]|nr:TIGR03557 family F420-dependent LLM class oxidoreductase [Nocardioides sp.]